MAMEFRRDNNEAQGITSGAIYFFLGLEHVTIQAKLRGL